jgi:hypothetical protein
MATPPKRLASTLLGLALLGRGRREGLAHFDASVPGFLASLAPWIAFTLVDGLVAAIDSRPWQGATEIAVLFCLLFLPPVLSERLAHLWGRDARWLRYVTASTWCEWLMLLAIAIGRFVAGVLLSAGLPADAAAGVLVAGVTAYWLWLHVFLARAALDLSWLRSSVVVLTLFSGTAATIALAWETGGHARAMFSMGNDAHASTR